MDRHSSTALALAEFLEREDDVVGRVYYPGLPTHPQAEVARRQLRTGGGMLAFDLGSRAAGTAFLDALDIGERTASLGSVHTIAVHPPSTTHRQLDEAELERAGIAPDSFACPSDSRTPPTSLGTSPRPRRRAGDRLSHGDGVLGAAGVRPPSDPFESLGFAVWRLLTSVRFAREEVPSY